MNEFFEHPISLPDDTILREQKNHSLDLFYVNGECISNMTEDISGFSAMVRKGSNVGFASDSAELNRKSAEMVLHKAVSQIADVEESGAAVQRTAAVRHRAENDAPGDDAVLAETVEKANHFLHKNFSALSSIEIGANSTDIRRCILTDHGTFSDETFSRNFLFVTLSCGGGTDQVSLDSVYGGAGAASRLFNNADELYEKLEQQYHRLMQKKQGQVPEAGIYQCVLGNDAARMLLHEAIGHPVEADMAMSGSIAAFILGKRLGCDEINIRDCAFEWNGSPVPQPLFSDDEGSATRDAVLVKNGIVVGLMHNRDSANHHHTETTGNARAFTYADIPLIRMRNTVLEPGPYQPEDLIGSVKHGIYIAQTGVGQADTTGEFMFRVMEAYMIENGKLGKACKDTVCYGNVMDVFKSIDMIGNNFEWDASGLCGKEQPMTVVSGAPWVRCRVQIGG